MAAMAAVKSKVQESFTKKDENVECMKKCDPLSFGIFDICLILLSLCTFIADLSTDFILVVKYFNYGHVYWAIGSLFLIIVPATVIQLFSVRWHIADENVNCYNWIAHIFLLGLVHRYIMVLKTGLEVRKSGDPFDFQQLYHQQNDICMLHLFESFMESAPQLVLQLYIMVSLEEWWSWTGVSAVASLCSLAWAMAAYTRAQRRLRPDKQRASPAALALQAAWRAGLLAARLAALLLLAAGAGVAWLCLLIGIHWIGMTTWIILQKTDFCPTPWEERVYNCIVGIIYCFCFFNLKEGPSRKRALAFYAVIIAQNMGCLGVFLALVGGSRPLLAQAGSIAVVGGTLLGLAGMLLYFRFFHPSGPITIQVPKVPIEMVEGRLSEAGAASGPEVDTSSGYRSLKRRGASGSNSASPQRLNNAPPQDYSPSVDDSCTDKKLLLNHWVSYPTAIPTEGVELDSDVPSTHLEDHSVDCSTGSFCDDAVRKQKRRGIFSAEALELELQEDVKDISVVEETPTEVEDKMKRRGICALEPEMEEKLKLEIVADSEISPVSSGIEAGVEDIEKVRRQKRRGILESEDLCLELEEEAKHIVSAENSTHVVVDMEAVEDSKKSSIASCDIIKEAVRLGEEMLTERALPSAPSDEATSEVLSAPSELLSAPSEVLSAHDYENICAVNIAREAWGLRSWRGYSDIETWLHDDSVVRDRRRDTLTSTVTTITSASSEQSGGSGEQNSSPPPLPSRRPRPPIRSRQDDYLDTLAEDLAACDRPLSDFTPEPEVDSSVYVARPYIVDQHGTFFPLTTLDTIMEEIEETSTATSDSIRHWQKHGSASTLVATIDEIRRGNSICSLYNSTELLCGSCGSPALSAMSNQEESNLTENNILRHIAFDKALIPASDSHLTAEEVLFLSKLRASDRSAGSTPNHSMVANNGSPQMVNPKISSPFSENVPDASLDDIKPLSFISSLGVKKPGNKTHRKFLLLRDKFESKQNENTKFKESMAIADLDSSSQVFTGSTEALVPDSNANESPAVIQRIHQWNNFLKMQNSQNESRKTCSPEKNLNAKSNPSSLKERRTMFLKQVLSPPRWSKKGAASPIGSLQVRAS